VVNIEHGIARGFHLHARARSKVKHVPLGLWYQKLARQVRVPRGP
jgi:hypothetical protein